MTEAKRRQIALAFWRLLRKGNHRKIALLDVRRRFHDGITSISERSIERYAAQYDES